MSAFKRYNCYSVLCWRAFSRETASAHVHAQLRLLSNHSIKLHHNTVRDYLPKTIYDLVPIELNTLLKCYGHHIKS